MPTFSLSRRAALVAACAVTFSAGCGGSSASVDEISAKLSGEPEFAAVKGALPADKYDKVVKCVAEYLHDKGKGSDIDDWISGKKKLAEVRGSDSESGASKAGGDCVKKAIQ